MKILVKFPTKSRPSKFLNTLNGYINNANNPDNIQFLVTIDDDDSSMAGAKEVLKNYKNVTVYSGPSISKVDAINRDMEKSGEWDILILASDDMICKVRGWDDILIAEMKEHFPDTDGVLWHNDGYIGMRLNTMCILGRAYYNRFNFIYHPEYKSLWCDNTFTDIANILGRQRYFAQCLFLHDHPSNTGTGTDDQYRHTESFYWSDKEIYDKHKANGFKDILK